MDKMKVLNVARRGISTSRMMCGEIRSSGGIYDPFVYRGKGGQSLPPMLTWNGLKTRWKILGGHLKSGVCAGVIQKHVPEFHASKFPPIANKVFTDFFEAHRKGDMHALAGLATEQLYYTLKGDMKQSEKKGKRRMAFRVVEFTEPTQVLQMREHRKKNVSQKEGWGQVTCKLRSRREIIPVDFTGKELTLGEGETAVTSNNITIGTFEVFFGDSTGKWRLALLEELVKVPKGSGGGVKAAS